MIMARTNSVGLWGFVFALLAFLLGWLPYLGGLLWVIGTALSCVGLSYRPRGFAWAGFWLSIIWIALWIMAICTIGEFTAFTLYPYYVW